MKFFKNFFLAAIIVCTFILGGGFCIFDGFPIVGIIIMSIASLFYVIFNVNTVCFFIVDNEDWWYMISIQIFCFVSIVFYILSIVFMQFGNAKLRIEIGERPTLLVTLSIIMLCSAVILFIIKELEK